jgi:intracellular sulfur oxidation DsrE/DsrF family protein
MRHFAELLAVLTLAAGATAAGAEQPPGFWTTPAIEGYGRIHPLPQGAYRPEAGKTYHIVFGMTMAPKAPQDINPALERVARAVNLYTSAGVHLDHLKFVAVAYGPATGLALNNAQYRAAFGVDNPNLPVIARLRKAGVDIAVCGQAVAEHEYQYEWVDASVTLALSAITTITTLEQNGYSLMQL